MSYYSKSNYTELADHESRITANESDILTAQSDISTNEANIDTLSTSVSTNASNISTNASNIATNAADIAALESQVGTLNRKVVAIGDWNMDSTGSVNVTHGVTAANIRSITGIIRNDAADTWYPINQTYESSLNVGIEWYNSTVVALSRQASGFFDSTDFDSGSYNRGYLVIDYV